MKTVISDGSTTVHPSRDRTRQPISRRPTGWVITVNGVGWAMTINSNLTELRCNSAGGIVPAYSPPIRTSGERYCQRNARIGRPTPVCRGRESVSETGTESRNDRIALRTESLEMCLDRPWGTRRRSEPRYRRAEDIGAANPSKRNAKWGGASQDARWAESSNRTPHSKEELVGRVMRFTRPGWPPDERTACITPQACSTGRLLRYSPT